MEVVLIKHRDNTQKDGWATSDWAIKEDSKPQFVWNRIFKTKKEAEDFAMKNPPQE